MQHNHSDTNPEQPDYDLHIPGFLTYPFPVSIFSILLGSLAHSLLQNHPVAAGFALGLCLLAGAAYVGFFSLLKRTTNLERRLKDRDTLLDGIPFQGDETVLDVGCGNGILIMGAAKRLTTGKGIGIDIYTDFSGDSRPEAFQRNARIEGVTDRVSLENEDVRRLPYSDASIDIIISGLTMHHISHGGDTKAALAEMIRVLKPGGRIALYDAPVTISIWAKLLRQNGLTIEKKAGKMLFGVKPLPDASE